LFSQFTNPLSNINLPQPTALNPVTAPTSNIVHSTPSSLARGEDPLTTFRFIVELEKEVVGAFTECKLPDVSWKPQNIEEGGLNTYVHQLPGQRKAAKITFKRGLGITNRLLDWYIEAMRGQMVSRQVTVKLLDPQKNPAITWIIDDAFPMKWSGLSLKSDSKTIAIATLMLSCGYIEVVFGDE
jgi:phage tail-like protein